MSSLSLHWIVNACTHFCLLLCTFQYPPNSCSCVYQLPVGLIQQNSKSNLVYLGSEFGESDSRSQRQGFCCLLSEEAARWKTYIVLVLLKSSPSPYPGQCHHSHLVHIYVHLNEHNPDNPSLTGMPRDWSLQRLQVLSSSKSRLTLTLCFYAQ